MFYNSLNLVHLVAYILFGNLNVIQSFKSGKP